MQDINFVGELNSLAVNSDADQVAVNCGVGSCVGAKSRIIASLRNLTVLTVYMISGTWDWSALQVSGGEVGPITNFDGIENFSQD